MGTFVLRITGVVTTVFDTLDEPQQAVALVPNLVHLMGNHNVPSSPIDKSEAGRELYRRPHMAFLRYPSAVMEPAHPRPGELPPETVLRYLNRHRVSFTFGGAPSPAPMAATAAATAPGRRWETYAASALTTKALKEDLSNVVNVTEITGRKVDPAHLAVHPENAVLAQVMIGGFGNLKAFPPESNLRWKLRSRIHSDEITRPLSHATLWVVDGVDEVEVHFDPLDPTPDGAPGPSSFKVAVSDQAPLVMTLASLCNHNPLEWSIFHETVVDEDLLWSFALLDAGADAGPASAGGAEEIEASALAPEPVFDPDDTTGASGSNCIDQTALTRNGAVASLFHSILG